MQRLCTTLCTALCTALCTPLCTSLSTMSRSIDCAHARLPAVHMPQSMPNSPLLQDGQGEPQSCHTLRQGLAWQKRPGMLHANNHSVHYAHVNIMLLLLLLYN